MSAESPTEASVAVVGLGYVGTCIATVLAETGATVHGIDIDEDTVGLIDEGTCPIEESTISSRFETHVRNGMITASTDYDAIEGCSRIVVTVGTPLDAVDPDISAVVAATEAIGQRLRPDQLVVYRSTLPAGTTESVVEPILSDQSDLTDGEEFYLAFCPERMAEGSAYEDLRNIPVVVGGTTDAGTRRAADFWEGLGLETIQVSNPTVAELAKLADNWWIDLNIAMANELALLAEQLDVDAMEVIRAANTLPKGQHHVNILYPGSGVGGSCLVKDPLFVANLAEEHGLDLETPTVSRRINDRMPIHLVDLVEDAIDDLDGKTVAILGYAFKGETDDTRNTPANPVSRELLDRGADLRITDPFVPSAEIEAAIGVTPDRLPDALEGADAVVVVTGHTRYQQLSAADLIDHVGRDSFAVVDGRFTFSPADFANSDVTFRGIGRPNRRRPESVVSFDGR